MEINNTSKVVYAALFTALIFVGTLFIQIPLPFGYFNFGDCFIILSAIIIGGSYAIIAAAAGAALADVLSGYIIYAPATLVIKSLMVIAMIIILKLHKNKKKNVDLIILIISAVVSELIMSCGYFIYDTILYGFTGAVATLPGNVLQGLVAVVASIIIVTIFEHSGLLKKIKLQ